MSPDHQRPGDGQHTYIKYVFDVGQMLQALAQRSAISLSRWPCIVCKMAVSCDIAIKRAAFDPITSIPFYMPTSMTHEHV